MTLHGESVDSDPAGGSPPVSQGGGPRPGAGEALDPESSGRIVLKPHEEMRILRGHRWVFSNEIDRIDGTVSHGGIVEVARRDGRPVGIGFYNAHSLIAVRLLGPRREPVTESFFEGRIRAALSLRQRLYPDLGSYRVVHGESDDLPGLIVDKYADCLSLQTLCLGMDLRLDLICDALARVFGPRAIVERNESHLREREGLPVRRGLLRGEVPGPTTIEEGDVRFEVDTLGGQKTGFFFDQRENRLLMRRYVPGMRVLDAYCADGAFALHAVRGGASAVLGIDVAEESIERARRNAIANGMESGCQFEAIDSLGAMESLHGRGERFDVVILDPPSFTRSRKNVPSAKKGYEEVNRKALRILRRGGILATASCSFHITDETFLECIQTAAFRAERQLRQLEWRTQAPDHPVIPAMPETRYLKFGVFQAD